jgi:hypothetical protein
MRRRTYTRCSALSSRHPYLANLVVRQSGLNLPPATAPHPPDIPAACAVHVSLCAGIAYESKRDLPLHANWTLQPCRVLYIVYLRDATSIASGC